LDGIGYCCRSRCN